MIDSSRTSFVERTWSWVWATGLLIPVGLLAALFYLAPHLQSYDWDYDEGINLMKALLLHRGYDLYTEIWSDQPPALTAALATIFHVVGPSVTAARVLIFVLSALLLWSFYLAVHKSASTDVTLVAVLLLVISEFYLRLSGAVMVGLPSLALAMTALMLLVTGRSGWGRIILAAVVMALALQTKLLAIIVSTGCAAAILFPIPQVGPAPTWPRRFAWLAVWSVTVTAAFLILGSLLGGLHFDLIVGTHLSTVTRSLDDFIEGSALFFPHLFEQHVAYLILGAGGILYAYYRRLAAALPPLVWLATCILAFQFHRPLWYHYTVLMTIPLCWLSAYGLAGWFEVVQMAWKRRPGKAATGLLFGMSTLLAITVAVLLFYPNPLLERFEWQFTVFRPTYIPAVKELLVAGGTDETEWVFTDHPFYAFQAGLNVPPPIAVLSRKSLESGIIRQEMLAQVIRDYKPRFVILERFTYEYSPEVIDVIKSNYTLNDEYEPAHFYSRND